MGKHEKCDKGCEAPKSGEHAGSRTERPHAKGGWSSRREASKVDRVEPKDMPPRGQGPRSNGW